jgi:hypothetical protein
MVSELDEPVLDCWDWNLDRRRHPAVAHAMIRELLSRLLYSLPFVRRTESNKFYPPVDPACTS